MTIAAIGRPAESEYAPYYAAYVANVPEPDLLGALEDDRVAMLSLLRSIPESRAEHRYEPGKWSIRQAAQHVVDTERVFCFRAFWFAREIPSPLPSFEQDDAVKSAPSATPLADIASELERVRQANILFFRALEPDAWMRSGTASGKTFTVRALAAIAVGHSRHHAAILRERYL